MCTVIQQYGRNVKLREDACLYRHVAFWRGTGCIQKLDLGMQSRYFILSLLASLFLTHCKYLFIHLSPRWSEIPKNNNVLQVNTRKIMILFKTESRLVRTRDFFSSLFSYYFFGLNCLSSVFCKMFGAPFQTNGPLEMTV